jgi:hypothetical protein
VFDPDPDQFFPVEAGRLSHAPNATATKPAWVRGVDGFVIHSLLPPLIEVHREMNRWN